jgi:Predicted membrane protein (DUF2232)
MRNPFLIGLGLGLVAAVVFFSASTGPLAIRFTLFFLTPLPLVLAGLGWGWPTAALAGVFGTALITIAGGPVLGLGFFASHALPVAVLSHLALLSRAASPGGNTDEVALEWYPPGRLVLWAALFAGLLTIGMLLMLGADLEELRAALRGFIDKIIANNLPKSPDGQTLAPAEIEALTDTTLALLPAASAFSWMSSLLFNFWIGGRITLASGQLARPWPDLAALDYPRGTSIVFAATLLATSLEGYAGTAASSLAGALFLAYVLVGLAIVHFMTRGSTWRPFILWALYAGLFLGNVWTGVAVAMLGLADTILQLRQRFPPAAPPDHSINS